MRALDVFQARHQFAQRIFYDSLYERYSEAQLRTPPHPSMNSLIWIMWHVARVEDAGVTRFVAREDQLLHRDDWTTRLDVETQDNGFGATREQMLTLSQKINIAELRAYWQSVIEYTMSVLDRLTTEALDERLSTAEVRQVLVDEGVGHPNTAEEAIGIYSGWTRLEALYHFSVTHYYWHGGEVRTVEAMMKSDD